MLRNNYLIIIFYHNKMVQVDVYGDTRATCVQRVLILLEELDLKYNVLKVDFIKNEHKA